MPTTTVNGAALYWEMRGDRGDPLVLVHGSRVDAAERFVEDIALGPGAWAVLPEEIRESFVADARTFFEEIQEPGAFALDVARLHGLERPILLTNGGQSPPLPGTIVRPVAAALPRAKRHTLEEAGHVPHLTHPAAYASVLTGFIENSRAAQ